MVLTGKYPYLSNLKACLHVPTPSQSPSQCPSKFNIVAMVDGQNDIMLNFDGHCYGDGHGVGTCKHSLIGKSSSAPLQNAINHHIFWGGGGFLKSNISEFVFPRGGGGGVS